MLRTTTLIVLLAISGAPGLEAATTEPERRPGPGSGLLFRPATPDAPAAAAPALRTDVRISVSGVIARVTVRQTFRNPRADWTEGVYVFPLPEKAAVDTMRMRIGDRIVEGEIREREQARRTYEKARNAGQRTSLIEQERPNIFTASVANIPPQGEIAVEIGYQQRLRFANGTVALRFPAVVGPRFIPGTRQVAGTGGTGWGINTDMVTDAERITPPVRHPDDGPANPLALTVQLDPGMPLAMLASPSHAIDAALRDDGRYAISLKGGDTPAVRDFVLRWKPDPGDTPFAALFRETQDGATYVMAIVAPPDSDVSEGPRIPREVVFVIDTSGSMHGESIAQARAALALALQRLRPEDRFNVVRFASEARALFDMPRAADSTHLGIAERFVSGLEAEGGTNIDAALDLALDGRIGGARLRQVVLITDGSVGNEAALFARIRRDIGDSRLFTVGIGSAPNSHFMRRSATFGRGVFTHIGSVAEVASTMARLFGMLEQPAMTGIAAARDGDGLPDQQPAALPDLYRGEPLVLTARLDRPDGSVAVSGSLAGVTWSRDLDLAAARPGAGIAKLWARDNIAAQMDSLFLGADKEAVRLAVLDLALAHGLVSKYTSLVAVDRTPVRPEAARLQRRSVPVDLPAGWSYAHVFGSRGATPATLSLIVGAVALFAGMLLLLARQRRAA